MHAVVVKVNIGDPDTAEQGLRDQVIPRASNAPGFVGGYWTRSDDGHNGLSIIVFDSEESARRAAEMIQGPEAMRPETVTLESVEVREIVGNA
jgi:heme-degrading monooxygenase HmoA